MKITLVGHSCLFIESDTAKFLLDPGEYSKKIIALAKGAEHIFVTHKHADHFDETVIKSSFPKARIYATKETSNTYPNTKFEIIKEGQKLVIGQLKVEVTKAVHGYNPILKGAKEAHEAVGYIFDDGKKVYITGDTICFPNEYKCDAIFLPVNNHGVCMSPFEAALFAKETGANIVIPYHLESPKFPADMNKVQEEFDKQKLNWKILQIGESIEL
jgi:L-ascorbate metabolism protein UlaG (beta-lactamase superfamily)